ncbi:MAG TPA: hypothetical protein VFN87_06395, partial [Solirubrobacteraceae bacterium]|nr:hypothetical protein [Solirubrobacteraceae bacterium]
MTVLPQLERELIDAHGRRRRVPGRRSRRRGWPPPRLIGAAVPVAAALVAAAVVVVFAGLGGGRRSGPAAPAAPNQIVLGASTLSPRLPLSEAIDRSLPVLRRRLHAVFAHARVLRFANSVVIDGVPRAGRPEAIALAAPGQLRFFDWEADVLTPNGRTVAQLPAQATAALQISQGTADGPGATGPGSLSLYAAVRLASRQPAEPPGTSHTAHGARYYLFGAPGSTACTTAAADRGTAPPPRQHCLLAGPAASTGA